MVRRRRGRHPQSQLGSRPVTSPVLPVIRSVAVAPASAQTQTNTNAGNSALHAVRAALESWNPSARTRFTFLARTRRLAFTQDSDPLHERIARAQEPLRRNRVRLGDVPLEAASEHPLHVLFRKFSAPCRRCHRRCRWSPRPLIHEFPLFKKFHQESASVKTGQWLAARLLTAHLQTGGLVPQLNPGLTLSLSRTASTGTKKRSTRSLSAKPRAAMRRLKLSDFPGDTGKRIMSALRSQLPGDASFPGPFPMIIHRFPRKRRRRSPYSGRCRH